MDELMNLAKKKEGKRRRISSYDRKGGNDDRYYIAPNERRIIAEMNNPGRIEHIWMTVSNENFVIERNCLRKVVLVVYWDDEKDPSILVPLGDFFGMGHAKAKLFSSAPLQMGPQDGLGLNCFFPMPYRKARFEILNECQTTFILYFYIDYREGIEVSDDDYRFHATFHRECPTDGKDDSEFKDRIEYSHGGNNLSGEGNFEILKAVGEGHYVGCHLDIDNYNSVEEWDWPGEGDDMIYIDGDKTPTIHGTGTEDYFSMAWCPISEYNSPYFGLILGGDHNNWKNQITYYRYHILDPINFEKDIRVTIEHGHNNHRIDDFCSTAYWYQKEPHMKLNDLPKVEDRMPIDHSKPIDRFHPELEDVKKTK